MSSAVTYNAAQLASGELTAHEVTALVRRYQRAVGLPPDGKCGPATQAVLDGWSPVATPSPKPWGMRLRPRRYRGAIEALIVHSSGWGKIPQRGYKRHGAPTLALVEYYQRSRGTHYVIGYDGAVTQVASELQRANGTGTKLQRVAEALPGGWERMAGRTLATLWQETWGHERTPLGLLPAHGNNCAVHVELPPLPPHRRSQLWFTPEQHEAVARLAVDVAHRNGFAHEARWWLPRQRVRLLGHGDYTPVSRKDRRGEWDPGGRRSEPRFDWALVYAAIKRLLGLVSSAAETLCGDSAGRE